jgi:hypothetical protein
MKRTSLAFLLLFVFICWTVSAMASPISYSSIKYEAYAWVDNNGVQDDETQDAASPPVSASVSQTPITSSAGWDNNEVVHASSSGNVSGVGSHGGGESHANATFLFTPDFPKMEITFDYGIETSASKNGSWTSGSVNAEVTLKVNITDIGALSPDWEFEFHLGSNDSQTGSIEKIVDLSAPGSGYRMFFSVWERTGAILSGDATEAAFEARGWMENIQVEAVPLPSTLMLFGSGLLGILGIRKMFLG